jgi:hypothetical protein
VTGWRVGTPTLHGIYSNDEFCSRFRRSIERIPTPEEIRTEEVDSCDHCPSVSIDTYFGNRICKVGNRKLKLTAWGCVHSECPLRNGPLMLRLKEGV